VYEIELGQDIIPKPNYGEAGEFLLMSIEEVWDALWKGEFNPNIVMTWVSYFVRNGILNAENEENLVEICVRLHWKQDLFIV
jgi:hypothetical protein